MRIKWNRKCMTLFLLFYFCLIVNNSYAQNGAIQGKITDKVTGKGLAQVNVSVKGTNIGSASRQDGRFVIKNIPSGEYTLLCSAVGYETVQIPSLEIDSAEPITLKIELEPTVIEMENIVVTASRRITLLKDTPDMTLVTPASEIRAIGAQTVSDVLEYMPGVSTEGGTGSGQPFKRTVSINGMPAVYSIVLVDGARLLSSHFHTGANVNMIPPENIERIEVVKGAASAQYGTDGLGGVVNIITRQGSDSPSINFSSYGGSRNTFHTGLSVSGPISSRVHHSLFSSWEQSDGLPVLKPVFRKDKLDYSLFCLMDRIDADISDAVKATASIHYVSTETPYKSDPDASRLFTPKFALNYSVSPDISVRTSGYYSQWKSEKNNERNEIASPEVILEYKGLANHFFQFGTEYNYRKFTRKRVAKHDQGQLGLFVQDEFSINPKLTVLGALRLDKVDHIDPVVSPKVSVLYKAMNPLSLRLSAGRGFKAPTVQDLYETLYSHPGDIHFRAGNPDLEPEYSTSVSGGLDWQPLENLNVIVYGYYSKIDNMITPVDHGLEDPTLYFPIEQISFITDSLVYIYRRENIHKATVQGAEIRMIWNMTRNYSLESGFAVTHNKNSDTGESLPYFPGKSFSVKLRALQPLCENIAVKGFIGLNATMGRKIWRFKRNAEHQLDLDDYQKLDLGVSLLVAKSYEIFFNVDNVLKQELHMYEDTELLTEGVALFRAGLRIHNF